MQVLSSLSGVIHLISRRHLALSTFLCMLVHLCGAIGMTTAFAPFFIAMTPINLMLMFMLLLWNEHAIQRNLRVSIGLAFFVGMTAEAIGVNTGLLFGSYAYGKVLGLQVAGVPLLIGLNWFCTVYCAYVTAELMLAHFGWRGSLISPFFVSVFTTVYDWIMEPVAVQLGFWTWNSPQIPLYNYACWFIISFLLILAFRKLKLPIHNNFAPLLLLVQTLFFLLLRFLL